MSGKRTRSPPPKDRLASAGQRLLQVLAILGLIGIFAVLLHKGYSDVTAIARGSASGEFWPALLRYMFRNLAGG
ncbi:hypothetical protein [Ramlibacter sp. AN1133]|uniref:hypothetical protein n=1 Tax=Ramlibacter sp. AN1133 TaxID=3133429 RepID=UPI0030BB6115